MTVRSQAQRLYRAEQGVWTDRGRPGILASNDLGAVSTATLTKAEHAAKQKHLRAETLAAIEDVMSKIAATSWWEDLQTGLPRPESMPTPYVHHGGRTSSFNRRANEIRFGSDDYLTSGPVVAHEIAHYVVHYLIGAVADDHGPEFAAVDLTLVELVMGAKYAQELRAAFARRRVRVAKLDVLPPVTEGPLIDAPAPYSEPVPRFEQPALFAA